MFLFKLLMVLTFCAAAATMLAGITSMGAKTKTAWSNRLMFARVVLCGLLLLQILAYIALVR